MHSSYHINPPSQVIIPMMKINQSLNQSIIEMKIDCTVHSNPPSKVIIPMMKINISFD